MQPSSSSPLVSRNSLEFSCKINTYKCSSFGQKNVNKNEYVIIHNTHMKYLPPQKLSTFTFRMNELYLLVACQAIQEQKRAVNHIICHYKKVK